MGVGHLLRFLEGPLPKYAPVQLFGKLTCEVVSLMSVWLTAFMA